MRNHSKVQLQGTSPKPSSYLDIQRTFLCAGEKDTFTPLKFISKEAN